MKAEGHRQSLAESEDKLLKLNTDLTEEVQRLTKDIHHHLGIDDGADPAAQSSRNS